jgi:hypothetical protein
VGPLLTDYTPEDYIGPGAQPPSGEYGFGTTTFGQVFRPGELPAGTNLAATIDGAPSAVQLDIKSTYYLRSQSPENKLEVADRSIECEGCQ